MRSFLLFVRVEYLRAVLRPDVDTLPVSLARVMDFKEAFGQRLIVDAGSIEHDTHGFGVTRDMRFHFLIGGILLMASDVAGLDGDDAGQLFHVVLHTPKASSCEDGYLCR